MKDAEIIGGGRHPIDSHVGKRIELCRKELGLELEALSINAGISIADLYRIETGELTANSVHLFNLSHALHVPINFFFEHYHNARSHEIERLVTAYLCIKSDIKKAKILCMIEKNT